MPWTCSECDASVPDDGRLRCPGCGQEKTAWTLVQNQTRDLVVGARLGFDLLRGEGGSPLPAGAATVPPSAPAQVAWAMSTSLALGLAKANRRPAPLHVLTVRLRPRQQDRTITLAIDLAQQEARVETHPQPDAPLAADGTWDAAFLFVYGPGQVPAEAFPGLTIVDVTDPDEPGGFAIGVEVSALDRPVVELPLDPVPKPRPEVFFVEKEDLHFRTDREILMPVALADALDGAAGQASGLAAIRTAFAFVDRRPQKQLLLAGHTDTAGSAGHNQTLSQARAENVFRYLSGDKAGWAAHCQANYERGDFKTILRFAAGFKGWDCEPGDLDDGWDDAAREARDAFRVAYNADYGGALERHVKQNEADWAAYFDLYDEALAGMLGITVEALTQRRASLAFVAEGEGRVGCGEHHPVDQVGVDGYASASNRRVDLLFFDEHDLPTLACHTGETCDPSACPLYRPGGDYDLNYLPVNLDDFEDPDDPLFEVWLQPRSHWLTQALPNTLYDLSGPTHHPEVERRGTTDADGNLREAALSAGHYVLRIAGSEAIVSVRYARDEPRVGYPDVVRIPKVAVEDKSPIEDPDAQVWTLYDIDLEDPDDPAADEPEFTLEAFPFEEVGP